jgi:hypothetical protein
MFQLETRVLADVTRLAPGFAFFDDSAGPNAFAMPGSLLGSADGTVAFGLRLLGSEMQEQGFLWDAAAIFIMAHEWSHIVEFSSGAVGETPRMELLADFMAGWYLGWKHRLGSQFDASGAAKSVFAKGDYAFNDPSHHGTPQQRLQAATDGHDLAFVRGVLTYPRAFAVGRQIFGI